MTRIKEFELDFERGIQSKQNSVLKIIKEQKRKYKNNKMWQRALEELEKELKK